MLAALVEGASMRRLVRLGLGVLVLYGFAFSPIRPLVSPPLPPPALVSAPELTLEPPAPLAPELTLDTKRTLEDLLSRA